MVINTKVYRPIYIQRRVESPGITPTPINNNVFKPASIEVSSQARPCSPFWIQPVKELDLVRRTEWSPWSLVEMQCFHTILFKLVCFFCHMSVIAKVVEIHWQRTASWNWARDFQLPLLRPALVTERQIGISHVKDGHQGRAMTVSTCWRMTVTRHTW